MFPLKKNNTLLFFSLMAVFVTIPLPMLLNNVAIIAFLIMSLIHIKKVKVRTNPLYLFFPVVFVLSALSLLYNCSFEMGIKSQEKILSFLLFYLFIPAVTLNQSQLKTILITFSKCSFLVLMWCFLVATYLSITNQSFIVFNPENLVNENYFFYHRFSSAVGLHAVYFSIFLVFSIFIDLYYFNQLNFKNKWLYILKIALFIIGLILLQSFAVLFAFAVIVGSYLLFFNATLLSKKFKLITLAIAIILPTFLFYNKANVGSKSIFEYNLADDIHNKNWNSLNVRLAKWECAIEASTINLPFGVGSGCTKSELKKVYLEKGFLLGYDKEFDTHNQYLHYFLELGIIGAAVFILFLIGSFYYSIRKNKFLLFSLLVLLAVSSMTENVLYSNQGIVFFSAFFYLLIKNHEE